MATVTIYDVYDALGLTADNGTQTLINSIRNSTDLKGVTDLFNGSETGLKDFGMAINSTSRTQNIFVNELVDRIGIVVINRTDLRNPLKRFKKGRIENGKVIQEIQADLIKAQAFNPEDAAQTLFKRNPPNVRALYYSNPRKELYPTTIEEVSLRQAFTSFNAFEEFVVTVYDALYNSNEVDEYLWTKGMMEAYVANGYATYVNTPNVTDEVSAKEFVKLSRATATKMKLVQGSRMFNAAGVHTRTPENRLWIMIDADLDATLDVDVLARAFNMNKTQIENQKIVVENFAKTGLQAILFDEDILKIYDREFRMNSAENAKGLYWNVFLHVHQEFNIGKLQNFVAFMSTDIPPVTRLTLTPFATYLTLGKEKVLDGFVTVRDDLTLADFDFTAEVVSEDGAKATGATATVTDKGNGQLEVKVKITGASLVDNNLTVNLMATEKVASDGETKFVRTASALIVPLPAVEG